TLNDGTNLLAESKEGAFSIPASVSFEYAINRNFSVGVEGMLYVITSDEVDAKPGGIALDMINYNSIGISYKFKSKRKARKSKIKYSLDPELYKAKPSPVEKEEVVVVQEEVIVEEPLVTPKDNDALAVQEHKEDAKKFPINHELEKEAIQKETWASNTNNPWPEIKFSVQILASGTNTDTKELQEKLGIAEPISVKYDGEWYRYAAGSYHKMWQAKELRNKLRSITAIKDAFIVVYRNDERISLEEALNYAARKQTLLSDDMEEDLIIVDQNHAAEKVYPLVKLVDNIPQEGIVIGVQVLSIRNDHYPLGVFKGIYGIDHAILVHQKLPWNKLIASGFTSYQEAIDYQYIARDKGFIDAFVVAFKDGRRISISTLKEELNK
ncbi:MAG: hypothetical protein GQ527_07860, partial [Bacteroidales bacterium]|nr:hypothetical protein [Bacteroidales bacterium]